jgi:tetratricopeptide (TPR) repeat protein
METIKKIKKVGVSLTLITVLGSMTLGLTGCITVDKGHQIERVDEIPLNQMSSGADDILFSQKLPDMTADEYEMLGDALLQKGDLPLAYLQYGKSLKLNPNNVRVEYKKGLALLKGQKNDDAIEQFNVVLATDPRYAPAYEGIGRAFLQKKDIKYAEEAFRRALKLDSQLWKSHNFLGNIYDSQKNYQDAVREYTAALAIKPNQGLVYNNLGVSYHLAGKYENAVKAFNKALAAQYNKSKVYNNLGLALAGLEQYPQALEAFKSGGGEAQAYNNLGCIYLSRAKYREAARCFEKAIAIDPAFYARAGENLERARKGLGYRQ